MEAALLFPFFLLLLLGIVELGSLFSDWLVLSYVGREAARKVSLGTTVASTTTWLQTYANTCLKSSGLTTTMTYATVSNGALGSWQTLTDASGTNVAPSGSQVRVALTYTHQMLAGSVLSHLINASPYTTMSVSATVTARRE